MSLWRRWVAFTSRPEDSRPLWLVRVWVPLAMWSDLVTMVWRDAWDAVLLPASMGGLGTEPANWAFVDRWWWGGPGAWAACIVALPMISAGVATRWAIVVAVVAHSQLGHLFVPGDRGIDRLLRTVLLILLFSGVADRRVRPQIAAWASDLVRWLLVLVYLSAGLVKLRTFDWFVAHPPELYTVLADPMAGHLDPVAWFAHPWPFRVGAWATIAVELTAPLILTRWARYWALVAAPIHIGIAWTMDLGMFSYGMLALYPVLVAPWVTWSLDAAAARFRRQ